MHSYILFTGHMIDKEGRAEPRFPALKEQAVRAEMKKHLLKIKASGKVFMGIAGGACGGDILFHELCSETGIQSEIYLALPEDEFKKKSVSFAGPIWEERYDALIGKIPVHVLPEEKTHLSKESVWALVNLWMLEKVLEEKNNRVILLALWNCKEGDGAGGTDHMIEVAKAKGAAIEIIDINCITG